MQSPLFHQVAILGMICYGQVSIAAVPVRGEGGMRQRFLEEAPQAWSELDEWVARHTHCLETQTFSWVGENVTGRMRRVVDWKQAGRNVVTWQGQFVRDGQGADSQSHEEEVIGVNATYAFRLSRASPDAPWVVTLLTSDVEYLRGWLMNGGQVIPSGWMMDLISMRDFLADPGFVVENVLPVRCDARECVEVAFRFDPSASSLKSRVRSGTVVLDPRRRWVLARSELHLANGNDEVVATTTFEYVDTPSAWPVLRRYQVDSVGYRPEIHRLVFEHDTSVDAEIPDSAFTLSAFGLPEPAQPGGGRLWFLWLNLAAVVCICLAVLLRKRALRAKAGRQAMS